MFGGCAEDGCYYKDVHVFNTSKEMLVLLQTLHGLIYFTFDFALHILVNPL